MSITLIIGKRGAGKTYFIKKYIGEKKAFIYNIFNEYPAQIANCRPLSASLPDQAREQNWFLNACLQMENTIMVFEESEMFFRKTMAPSAEMFMLLDTAKKLNNELLFVFRSPFHLPTCLTEVMGKMILFNCTAQPDKRMNLKIHIAIDSLSLCPAHAHYIINNLNKRPEPASAQLFI